ncbi:hypothetical protein H6F74_23050 [Trichocoleus sp. FACHB-90]|uniref:hypothetical protein n=1 Tax=Cyanophyceae TaxID=3028117 RepID=UPI0016871DC8|nr:hypothetical protein [Trichocoleus sp. FACHB-90]MBD1929099.1 hypothetical protein [Trichocoleus sp. FACHB-90]
MSEQPSLGRYIRQATAIAYAEASSQVEKLKIRLHPLRRQVYARWQRQDMRRITESVQKRSQRFSDAPHAIEDGF